uniref:Uncharacterized protein n=1 Tax=viral metagenome TaxID=1070528 RepID=A0A6M3LWB7_9ZZZZ
MNASKAAREIVIVLRERWGNRLFKKLTGNAATALRWEIRRALRAERLRGRAEGAKMALDELRTAKKGE